MHKTIKPEPLNLLVLDDSADDISALLRRLAEAGYQLNWQRGLTEKDLRAALNVKLDVIFADTNLSQLSIRRVMDLLSELRIEIPLVILSASTNEECGLEGLAERAGAVILKNRLDLTVPIVRKALRHAAAERELKRAKLELQNSKGRSALGELNAAKILPARPQTILFVDDDLNDRRITGLSLVRHGYVVLPAQDVTSALKRWADHAGEIDLLITSDALAGGTSGYDLAAQLLACQPTLKAIVTTSGTVAPALPSALPLLEKPFTIPALLQLIRQCLNKSKEM